MDLDVPSANLSVGRDSNVPIGNVTSIDNMSTGNTEKNGKFGVFSTSVFAWPIWGGPLQNNITSKHLTIALLNTKYGAGKSYGPLCLKIREAQGGPEQK